MVMKKLSILFLGLFLISLVSAWSVEINYPSSIAYSYDISKLDWYYTGLNKSDIFNVWYDINGNISNFPSYTDPDTIMTINMNSQQDNNTCIIYVNTTSGEIKNASVTFWVDSIEPELNYVTPSSFLSYTNSDSFVFQFNLNEINKGYYWGLTDKFFYLKVFNKYDPINHFYQNVLGIDSNNNSEQDTVDLIGGNKYEGNYTWIVFAKDIYPNGSTIREVNLTGIIIRDTINPNISIIFPESKNYSEKVTNITYSVSDDNLDYCVFNNGSASENLSCSNGVNVYNTESVEGNNQWSVTVYDKAGNSNVSSVSFFVDSLAPNVKIISPPVNGSSYNYDFTELNFSVFDVALDTCWFNNGTDEWIINCSENLTGISSREGSNNWTIYANDSFGHVNSSTVVFSVDTTPPVIILNNESYTNVEINTEYIEYGATAWDNVDKDVTSRIIIDNSSLDTSVLGTYIVTYTVSDSAGNTAQKNRTVIVQDTTPPVITLNGSNPQYIKYNTSYIELNASVTDNSGESLNVDIDSSSVDVNTLGSYNVSYYAEDSSGNNVTVIRTVIVQDTTSPVITLNGNSSIVIERTDNYSDKGATAWDNYDGNLTDNITIIYNDVNTDVVGNYSVVYYVKDSNGNNATAVRNVEVIDTVTPLISVYNPVDNTTYTTNLIQLNVESNEPVTWEYSINNGSRISFNVNETISLSNGDYNMTIYCRDAGRNENFTIVSFKVNKPSYSGSGGGGGSCSNKYNCTKWSKWSICENGIQDRVCLKIETVACGKGMTLAEINKGQTQECSFSIVKASSSEESVNENENLEEKEQEQGKVSGITGGVIGFAKSGKGILAIIALLALLGAAGVVYYKKRKNNMKL